MIFKNYYKVLGLTNNVKSTQSEIKSAYREQAKKYHPDVNVNNKAAEERFKDINEAYRILSDAVQKKKYDKSWQNIVGKKLEKEKSSKKEVNVNDFVNIFFGADSVKKTGKKDDLIPVKGENIETKIDISIKEAYNGVKKNLSFNSTTNKKIVGIDIPKGIKNGDYIKVLGQGKKGKDGGANGDLIVKINIVDNKNFELENDDITVKLLITPWDAALGVKTVVDGIDEKLTILVPKGTQSGDKISIPNRGYYKNVNNNERGNLIVKTKIVVPKSLSDEEKELFVKLKEISSFKPNNI